MAGDTTLSQHEAIEEFWKHVTNRTTVMLGLSGAHDLQPMTAFTEQDDSVIWFFTRNDTDLAREVAAHGDGRLVFNSPDDKLFADVTGELAIDHDAARIDRYWNPVVAAWYPDGKDDPHLTLLRFAPQRGQIWASKQGLARFAFEITRANVTKTEPRLGGTSKVDFGRPH